MRIGIVGAGLLGAGAALELALRGHDIEIFEREASSVSRASRQNEGKVHLGFVYGHDASLATPRLMARGAYTFAPLLRRWLDTDQLPLVLSSPFHYLVHRDSLMCSAELGAFYDRVVEIAGEECERPSVGYVCEAHRPACRRLERAERQRLFGDAVVDAYLTTELAVDPEPLAALVAARLEAEPRVTVHTNTTVTRVRSGSDAVTVDFAAPEGTATERFDHVVNASWDDLVRLDRTMGIEPVGAWSYRLKRYLRVAANGAPTVPSATVVLGRFGDVVRYGSGDLFLSWYPAGCAGLSTDVRHPEADHPTASSAAANGLRRGIVAPLVELVPSLAHLPADCLDEAAVQGGIILAQGTTDIDDPRSLLHARSTVGPRTFGRYHTVDTGKWTTAPLFAREVARRIAGDR